MGEVNQEVLGVQADSSARRALQAELFAAASDILLLLYCLTAALSIVAAQLILYPVLVYWVVLRVRGVFPCSAGGSEPGAVPPPVAALAMPVAMWVAVSAISAAFGIHVHSALFDIAKSSLMFLLPFCVYDSLSVERDAEKKVQRILRYLAAFVVGQTVAAASTIFTTPFGDETWDPLPGPITESGQLVLVLPCLAALFILGSRKNLLAPIRVGFASLSAKIVAPAGLFLAIGVAWPRVIGLPDRLVFHLLFALCFLAWITLILRDSETRRQSWLWVSTILLLAALVINLKRGPWFGVLVEIVCLGLLIRRRMVFWLIAGAVMVLAVAGPVRSRLLNFEQDFSISGGRKSMWALGVELVQRYPVGLGPRNASYMRQLDPTVPPAHRHMHNNLLNVAVETGWIGLAVYLWWMLTLFQVGIRRWLASRGSTQALERRIGLVSFLLTLAFLGWQAAGSVEYNFGKGEIRFMALFFMGLLVTLAAVKNGNGNGSKAAA